MAFHSSFNFCETLENVQVFVSLFLYTMSIVRVVMCTGVLYRYCISEGIGRDLAGTVRFGFCHWTTVCPSSIQFIRVVLYHSLSSSSSSVSSIVNRLLLSESASGDGRVLHRVSGTSKPIVSIDRRRRHPSILNDSSKDPTLYVGAVAWRRSAHIRAKSVSCRRHDPV